MGWGEIGFLAEKINSKFNEKDYTPITKIISATPTTINQYRTALSITGSGYIKQCTMYASEGTNISSMKITIDGVLVFWGESEGSSSTKLTGIYDKIDFGSATYGSVFHPTTTIEFLSPLPPKELPYTGNGRFACPVSNLLFFNQSLLIEITSGSTSTKSNICVFGGVKQ